jgi:hypothetical protein
MFSTIRVPNGRHAIALCLALVIPSVGTSAEPYAPHDFSADIVSRNADGLAVGAGAKLHAANHKVRIETPGAGAGFFLIDGEAGTALFVQTSRQIIMEAKQSTRLTRVFVPVDPKDPCPQWQAAETNAGVSGTAGNWQCTRIDAGEYRVLSTDGSSSQRWIDPDLQFPVKLQEADGTTIALEHIRVEAQPAGLFAVPPEYRKVDPQGLIERIQHSDVWAAPGPQH